eukprot:TRINITY_DN32510_c0_g1_i1.p1 TRINITY_DN32510_c0_g1~~TRINITY_DN32510_c0_g1_i1.p1  ORF type:complete len:1551 (-),score=292.74 TRINITY_DN32510_c0_g1_i1:73-4560(-)
MPPTPRQGDPRASMTGVPAVSSATASLSPRSHLRRSSATGLGHCFSPGSLEASYAGLEEVNSVAKQLMKKQGGPVDEPAQNETLYPREIKDLEGASLLGRDDGCRDGVDHNASMCYSFCVTGGHGPPPTPPVTTLADDGCVDGDCADGIAGGSGAALASEGFIRGRLVSADDTAAGRLHDQFVTKGDRRHKSADDVRSIGRATTELERRIKMPSSSAQAPEATTLEATTATAASVAVGPIAAGAASSAWSPMVPATLAATLPAAIDVDLANSAAADAFGGSRLSAAEIVARQLPPGPRVVVLGDLAFKDPSTQKIIEAMAKQFKESLAGSLVVLTGGAHGVQEVFSKALGADFPALVHLVPSSGEGSRFGVGVDVIVGGSPEDRSEVLGQLGHVYISVEGGLNVAKLARCAFRRGAIIVPLVSTGGASAGMYDFPQGALECPSFVTDRQWARLKDRQAPPDAAAKAVVDVISAFLVASGSVRGIQGGASSDSHAQLASTAKPRALKVRIFSACGLRESNPMDCRKSNPYCVCELAGKPNSRFQTKVVMNCLDPVWDETAEVGGFMPGDSLELSVFDRHNEWPNHDGLLGRASLPSQAFYPGGFVGSVGFVDSVTKANLTMEVAPASPEEAQETASIGGTRRSFRSSVCSPRSPGRTSGSCRRAGMGRDSRCFRGSVDISAQESVSVLGGESARNVGTGAEEPGDAVAPSRSAPACAMPAGAAATSDYIVSVASACNEPTALAADVAKPLRSPASWFDATPVAESRAAHTGGTSEAALHGARAEVDLLERRIATLEEEGRCLRQRLRDIAAVEEECQELRDRLKEVAPIREENKELRERLRKVASLEEENQDFRQQLRNFASVEEENREFRDRLRKAACLEEEMWEFRERLRKVASVEEENHDLQERIQELSNMKAENDQLRERLRKAALLEDDNILLKDKLREVEERNTEIAGRCASLTTEKETLRSAVDRLQRLLQNADANRQAAALIHGHSAPPVAGMSADSSPRPLSASSARSIPGGAMGTLAGGMGCDVESALMEGQEARLAPQRLRVSVVGATGLRYLNLLGDAPCCVCEVKRPEEPSPPHGSRRVSCQTRSIPNTLDPLWNETYELAPWYVGDSLKFTIVDKGGLGSRTQGWVSVPSDAFYPSGFDGELPVGGCRNALLRVRIVLETADEASRDFPAVPSSQLPAHSFAESSWYNDHSGNDNGPSRQFVEAEQSLQAHDAHIVGAKADATTRIGAVENPACGKRAGTYSSQAEAASSRAISGRRRTQDIRGLSAICSGSSSCGDAGGSTTARDNCSAGGVCSGSCAGHSSAWGAPSVADGTAGTPRSLASSLRPLPTSNAVGALGIRSSGCGLPSGGTSLHDDNARLRNSSFHGSGGDGLHESSLLGGGGHGGGGSHGGGYSGTSPLSVGVSKTPMGGPPPPVSRYSMFKICQNLPRNLGSNAATRSSSGGSLLSTRSGAMSPRHWQRSPRKGLTASTSALPLATSMLD